MDELDRGYQLCKSKTTVHECQLQTVDESVSKTPFVIKASL